MVLGKQFLKGKGGINQTIGIKIQSRCFHPGRRLPLPAPRYPRNHLLAQRHRQQSIQGSHMGPGLVRQAHSSLILRAGRSQRPLRAECLNTARPRTARRWTVSLSPPASPLFTLGQTCYGVSCQRLGLDDEAHVCTEKGPHTEKGLCLVP